MNRQPNKADRLACMLETILCVWKGEAWDVANHILGDTTAPLQLEVNKIRDATSGCSISCSNQRCR